MTQKEKQLISIIKKAKACIECEEDIIVDDDIVQKIFYEKVSKSSDIDNINNTSTEKRKELTYGNI